MTDDLEEEGKREGNNGGECEGDRDLLDCDDEGAAEVQSGESVEMDIDQPATSNVKFRGQSGQLVKHALVSQVSGDLQTAVRMYLMAFKLDPTLLPSFLVEFKQALTDHTSALMSSGRSPEAIALQSLAASLLPSDAWALTSLGRLHFLSGNEIDAGKCWRSAVAAGSGDCREAKESLDCLNSRIINRWHYRMINDAVRNACYQAAISRALRAGTNVKTVLDIGCGTGLLSMYAAAEANAGPIYACEMSSPIIDLAREVLEANGMAGRIKLMHAHSEDIAIREQEAAPLPSDGGDVMGGKVDLVVTETADCGLLGEGMLPSLQHAKAHLVAEGGQVIPAAADVFAVLVESPLLRSQMWVNPDAVCGLDLTSAVKLVPQDPYLCEYLSECGHRLLCDPFHALRVHFDSPEGYLPEPRACPVPVTSSGRVDAIVAWYRLWLDSESCFSTSPFPEPGAGGEGAGSGGGSGGRAGGAESREGVVQRTSCWEQAMFVPAERKAVEGGWTVSVNVSSAPRRLLWSVHTGAEAGDGEGGGGATEDGVRRVEVGERVVSVINDRARNEAYAKGIAEAVQGGSDRVLDLGHGWSLWGMLAAREGAGEVLAMDPPEDEEAFKALLRRNGAGGCVQVVGREFGASMHERLVCVASRGGRVGDPAAAKSQAAATAPVRAKAPSSFTWKAPKPNAKGAAADARSSQNAAAAPATRGGGAAAAAAAQGAEGGKKRMEKFGVIVADCVDPGGLLRQGALEDLRFVGEHLLREGGVVLPARVTVVAAAVASAQLRGDNFVDASAQGGADVRLLDRFSLSSLMSVDLPTLEHTPLSSPVDVLTFDLRALRPSYCAEVGVTATGSGSVDAIVFWFRLELCEGVCFETRPAARQGRATEIGAGDAHPPHWRQAAWMLRDPLPLSCGERLALSVSSVGSYLAWDVRRVPTSA